MVLQGAGANGFIIKFGSLLRAVMFMVVAYVTSYLTLRRNRPLIRYGRAMRR